ncbi:MAG: FecR family protein, partial [Draconibacterium sp.]
NVTVPFGAKTNITLPDGSLVWLNSGSTLSFSSEFEDKRPVVLVGEAFFEVEKSDKPFIVSTNFGDVEVKGTSFNVKAYTEENTLQATLVSGSVLVREKDSKKEVTLEPGQQANLVDEEITLSNVETELFISWKDGKLIFRKEYLPAAIKRLERWHNVKIELANDKRLDEIWISGTLEMESFSEVLELLKVTSPIDYLYNEKTRTIKIFYKKK